MRLGWSLTNLPSTNISGSVRQRRCQQHFQNIKSNVILYCTVYSDYTGRDKWRRLLTDLFCSNLPLFRLIHLCEYTWECVSLESSVKNVQLLLWLWLPVFMADRPSHSHFSRSVATGGDSWLAYVCTYVHIQNYPNFYTVSRSTNRQGMGLLYEPL